MLETSARLLQLLSLLQARRDWTGLELADRLDVGLRTVRRDIGRLRTLGYPVHAVPGVAGGYRLGAGAALPPLLLDDEEAVAVAVGLRTAATGTVAGMAETSVRALAKLEQVLPSRLRNRVNAIQSATVPLAPPAPSVDPALLAAIATACRDHLRLRLGYRAREGAARATRTLEPHRVVHTPRRWYLLAWDLDREDWRTFRLDRLEGPLSPPGPRFTPRPPPDDVAAFVSQTLASAPYRYQARILMYGPAEEVAKRASPSAGRLEAVDEHTCVMHTGSNSLEELALYVAVKGFEFEVLDPPELVGQLRALADRLQRAAAASPAEREV